MRSGPASRGHLRKEGIDAPDRLDRNTEYDAQWREPNLLFSQACGYDVLYDHAPHLTVIATPRYAARGCEGACYRSAIVVRQSEGAATVAALKGKRGPSTTQHRTAERTRCGRTSHPTRTAAIFQRSEDQRRPHGKPGDARAQRSRRGVH